MKKLVIGLSLLGLVATVSIAGQGAGVGGSYQDGLLGPLLKYDWMFSKNFGVECRVSYLTGSQDADVTSTEEHYQSGVHVRSRQTATSTIWT